MISRREFMFNAAALGLSASALTGAVTANPALAAFQAVETASAAGPPLDIAEWSFFWVGVERVELARGAVVNGRQMYVEYQVPAEVRHPYPVVLVHGGGGQGLDWMGTPDGRRGWATYLLEQGFRVYVVDRPGHGRSPRHPELQGPFPAQHLTLETISQRFTPQAALQPGANEFVKLHDQWPGSGAVGTPELAQMVASQGGSFLGDIAATHTVWRQNGAELLDKIGPAVIMTHSAGGSFGYLVAEARPNLVKGIVVVEGGGTAFAGNNRWGITTIPMTYDPPVSDPSEIRTVRVTPSEPGVGPYLVQEVPARRLRNLQDIPIVVVTAEASFASPGNPGQVAFLRQAGCDAEELRLASHGVSGNGHMMMLEKNNREALQPIIDWIGRKVDAQPGAQITQLVRTGESAPFRLANQGYFWVGTEHKEMPYGTVIAGQMYVQYLIPAEVRHPYPVVLVHGGGGQGTHYMGLGSGHAGWAHYYLQEGYSVYLVDRPGHGRSVYHPDSLGPINAALAYSTITGDFQRAANNPNRRWEGTGDVGDPWIDQFQAGQNSTPQDGVMASRLWASRGAELLDRIGPAIVQTHSAGGPFGWLVADQRPNLVKAIVCFEGAGAPFGGQNRWGLTNIPLEFDPPVTDPAQIALREVDSYRLQAEPARKLKNLQGIPIVIVTAEASGRDPGPAVEFLRQAGCTVDDLQMKDRGILGNGHFMMLETNRRQAFDVIRGWMEEKVRA